MMLRQLLFVVWLAAVSSNGSLRADKPQSIETGEFEQLHQMIKPQPSESRWMEIDWYPRMARFHLTPQRAMTSEGGIKSKRSIKDAGLSLTVTDVSSQHIRMELKGFIHWGSDYDERPGKNPFGFAFEVATGDSPTDRIPPGGNGRYVSERGYFADAK